MTIYLHRFVLARSGLRAWLVCQHDGLVAVPRLFLGPTPVAGRQVRLHGESVSFLRRRSWLFVASLTAFLAAPVFVQQLCERGRFQTISGSPECEKRVSLRWLALKLLLFAVHLQASCVPRATS